MQSKCFLLFVFESEEEPKDENDNGDNNYGVTYDLCIHLLLYIGSLYDTNNISTIQINTMLRSLVSFCLQINIGRAN